MANLYQFVNRKSIFAPTVDDVNNAENVASVDLLESIAADAGEYAFNDSSADAKNVQALASKAVSVSLWTEKTANGHDVIRGSFKHENGKTYRFRTYGTKGQTMPDTTTTDKAKIASLTWGVCFQDGKLVDEMKAINGRCYNIPVFYLKLA